MTLQQDNTATLAGSEGYIEIPVPWKPPVKQAAYVLGYSIPPRMEGNAPSPPARQTFHVDAEKELYALEADDFAAAVLDGAPPRLSRQDTLGNMQVLDEIREQIGLKF